jgi:2-oxoglutarate ferredoxin oxidoreductase subunit delta
MAKVYGQIVVETERCKGCELCVVACPEGTIGMSDVINKKGYKYAMQIYDNCTGCTNCALVCPDAIITVYRKKIK